MSQGRLQLLAHVHDLLVSVHQTAGQNARNIQTKLPACGSIAADELEHPLVIDSPKNGFSKGLNVSGSHPSAEKSHLAKSRSCGQSCDLLAVSLIVFLGYGHLARNQHIKIPLLVSIIHDNLVLGQNPFPPELQFLQFGLGNVCAKPGIRQVVTGFNYVFAMQKFHCSLTLDC